MSDIEIIIRILSSTSMTTKLGKNRNRLHKPRNHAQAKKPAHTSRQERLYYLYVGIGCDAVGRHPRKKQAGGEERTK